MNPITFGASTPYFGKKKHPRTVQPLVDPSSRLGALLVKRPESDETLLRDAAAAIRQLAEGPLQVSGPIKNWRGDNYTLQLGKKTYTFASKIRENATQILNFRDNTSRTVTMYDYLLEPANRKKA